MVHTIAAGFTTLEEQSAQPSPFNDSQRAAEHKAQQDQQVILKKNQLEMLRDLLK